MAAGRQATGSIITDVGDLYKRLLNHKPVIQNEVHFFVKEFELKREDSGLRSLQDAMRFANEMDTILLEEIMSSSHKFKQINTVIETVNGAGGQVFDDENSKLSVPKSEQEALDRQVEECRRSYHKKQEQYDTEQSKHVELLKEEIQTEREGREKLRPPSQATSVGSSVTIFPPEAQLSEESGSPPTEDEGTTSSGVEIEAEHNENNPADNLVNHEDT